MTLLLAVGDTTQVHLSSDYRLSDGGKSLLTTNGAKQLSVSSRAWTAQIAFTGIAWDGHGYKTRDWLVQCCAKAASTLTLDEFVAQLSQEATTRLAGAKSPDTRLTVVIAAAQDDLCRLFTLSNWERYHRPPLTAARSVFDVVEQGLRFPVLNVNGCEAAVPRSARRHLIRLIRESAPPKQIRAALAGINRMAAVEGKWKNVISQECWVHSLLSDGQSAGTNEGNIPGIPPTVILGFGDTSEMLKNGGITALPGQRILRQTASYRGPGTPLPPPTGDPRSIPFSSGQTSRDIGPSEDEVHATLTISGFPGTLTIRKNEEVQQAIGTVMLKMSTSAPHYPPYSRRFLELPNPPTIDGAAPRSWNNPFDVEWDGMVLTVTMQTSSMAFRSANYDKSLPHLGIEEELSMAAPHRELVLSATRGAPTAETEVIARFLLRDFPELAIHRRPI